MNVIKLKKLVDISTGKDIRMPKNHTPRRLIMDFLKQCLAMPFRIMTRIANWVADIAEEEQERIDDRKIEAGRREYEKTHEIRGREGQAGMGQEARNQPQIRPGSVVER